MGAKEDTAGSGDYHFTIKYAEDLGEDFLPEVFEMDKEVYGFHPAYVGELKNMLDRYRAFPKGFVYLMSGDDLAGYIGFFPVREAMWRRITAPEEEDLVLVPECDENGDPIPGGELFEAIPDDDILGKDIVYDPCPQDAILTDENGKGYVKRNARKDAQKPGSEEDDGKPLRLFIISVAVREKYRLKESHTASTMLADAWIEYMNLLRECTGRQIEAIAAVTVSEGGRTFMRSRQFHIERECGDEDRSLVYVCNGDCLERLLAGQYYRKTFRDDVFMMLPFEAEEGDERLEQIPAAFDRLSAEEKKKLAPFSRYLMEKLKESRDFECKNEVSREVTEHYLGEFLFLHTLDDYCDENEENYGESPTIIGEEKIAITLLMHRRTHMYLILLLFPESRYSTSQILDQCSKNYLKIRSPKWETTLEESEDPEKPGTWRITGWDDPKADPEMIERLGKIKLSHGVYHYAHIDDYLEAAYGLVSAGTGKALTCMTGEPKPQPGEDYVEYEGKRTTREMMNILSGETYFSLFQNFRILNDDLKRLATTNRSMYDYYISYMSERTIAFVLTEKVLGDQTPDSDFCEEYGIEEGTPEYMTLTKIGLSATMLFIMELVMFQNTALAKMTTRVSRALTQAGNVPWEYIDHLYQEYGKTIRFWKKDNFKYYGTACEAREIREAFNNDDIKAIYNEQQEYLQKIVDLNAAEIERKNSAVINIVGILLAMFQVRDYVVVELISRFYGLFPQGWIADPQAEAGRTFNVLVFGGFLVAFLVVNLLHRRNFYYQMRSLISDADFAKESLRDEAGADPERLRARERENRARMKRERKEARARRSGGKR
ncbi:MAG: hypothetical protein IKS07_02535 [Lachnospiraceae bacterium]|nr:hypothetical protein [Lachnospiraceae bacterium]